MKQLLKRTSKFFKTNYLRLIILLIILGLFFLFSFNSHIVRLGTSIKSFGINFIYYIKTIFNPELEAPNDTLEILITQSGGSIFNLINFDFQNFFKNFGLFFKLFINLGFLNHWWQSIASSLSDFSISLNILLTLFLIGFMFYKLSNRYKENDYAEDTKSLTNFKKIGNKLKPVFLKVKKFFVSLFNAKWFKVSLIILILFYFQIITTSIDLISNYFLFCANFDFMVLGDLVILTLINILPVYFSIPLIFRLVFIYWVFDKLRLLLADRRMKKCLDTNIDFLTSQSGNVILITGASRVGKNSLATCLSLIYEKYVLPDELLSIMLDIERKFPFINYSLLTSYLDVKISNHEVNNQNDIYSLFFKNDIASFVNPGSSSEVWDNLTIESVNNALCDYSLAYFFYTIKSPLSVSNYAISFNSKINDKPHYFNVDHLNILKEKQVDYCHRLFNKVLNFDYMRLGRKFDTYGENAFIPDIGVFNITEAGKERGDTDSVKSSNKYTETVNKRNDKFNERLKIWSHIATIRYRTLFKLILDEQQDMDINVALRRCSETILTLDRKRIKKKLALKSWSFEQTICKWLLQKYDDYSLKRKEIKLNNSLLNYLIKLIISKINLYFLKRVNLYSYSEIKLFARNGSTDGVSDEITQNTLFIINKIAYSGRYETTSLKRLFLRQMATSKTHFDDLRSYTHKTPTDADYRYMHSFLYDEIFKM